MSIKNSVVYSYYQDYDFSRKLKDIDYNFWILLIDTNILNKRHFMLKINQIKTKQIPNANYHAWILSLKDLPMTEYTNQTIEINNYGNLSGITETYMQNFSYYLINYNGNDHIYYYESGDSILQNDNDISYYIKAEPNETIYINKINLINNNLFNTNFKQLVKIYDEIKISENFIRKELNFDLSKIKANNGDSTNINIGNDNEYIIDNNNLYIKSNSKWNLITIGNFMIESNNLKFNNKNIEINLPDLPDFTEINANKINSINDTPQSNGYYIYNNQLWEFTDAWSEWNQVMGGFFKINSNNIEYNNKFFKIDSEGYINEFKDSLVIIDSKNDLYNGMSYESSYKKTTYDVKYLNNISLGLEGDNLFMVSLFLRSKTNSTIYL